jgi:SIR2-like domain
MAEPPYGVIMKQLGKGRVVPFLGAGASVVGRPEGVQWSPTAPFPPRGAELSALLARNAEFASVSANAADQRDLLKVSAYYEQASGRDALREELHTVLAQPYAPGSLHQLLASIDALKLVVTTNYDTLLEHAFRDAGRPFDLVIYPRDSDESGSAILHWPNGAACPQTLAPDDLQIDLTGTTVIFKMHGTIDDRSTPAAQYDNFVITEDDYIDFLCRMTSGTAVPKSFLRHFRDRSFLFLGYSLADWNMRVVLRNLGREFAVQSQQGHAPKHWAVQDQPSPVEQWLWGSRGVNVYDQRIETFVDKLKVATLV